MEHSSFWVDPNDPHQDGPGCTPEVRRRPRNEYSLQTHDSNAHAKCNAEYPLRSHNRFRRPVVARKLILVRTYCFSHHLYVPNSHMFQAIYYARLGTIISHIYVPQRERHRLKCGHYSNRLGVNNMSTVEHPQINAAIHI